MVIVTRKNKFVTRKNKAVKILSVLYMLLCTSPTVYLKGNIFLYLRTRVGLPIQYCDHQSHCISPIARLCHLYAEHQCGNNIM